MLSFVVIHIVDILHVHLDFNLQIVYNRSILFVNKIRSFSEDDVDNITEAEIENIPNNVISQAVDPDYFVDAEDLFESNSDEVFQQRRKSKRKHSSLVPVVPNSDVTPRRRTKRRLN